MMRTVIRGPPLFVEERGDGARKCQGVLLWHYGHVVSEDLAQLHTTRVIGRDDRRAGRQRLERHRRARFEQRRQHEGIGGRVEPRDGLVVHEAREGHVSFHAVGARDDFQLVEQRTGPADDKSRVGVRAHHFAERLEQVALAGQRVQALHVHQDVPRADAERHARGQLRAGVVVGELWRHWRVDD